MADETPEGPQYQLEDVSHGMTVVASAFVDGHMPICRALSISPMDFLCALANAQAWILADQTDMPEEVAMERLEHLHRVMQMAY